LQQQLQITLYLDAKQISHGRLCFLFNIVF